MASGATSVHDLVGNEPEVRILEQPLTVPTLEVVPPLNNKACYRCRVVGKVCHPCGVERDCLCIARLVYLLGPSVSIDGLVFVVSVLRCGSEARTLEHQCAVSLPTVCQQLFFTHLPTVPSTLAYASHRRHPPLALLL